MIEGQKPSKILRFIKVHENNPIINEYFHLDVAKIEQSAVIQVQGNCEPIF